MGKFASESVQNIARGYTQEAENQIVTYNQLTDEQKRKHAENKQTLDDYYRKLGIFGLNPIARNAIEKSQGAAYIPEAADMLNELYEDFGRVASGNPVKNKKNQAIIDSYGIGKGTGTLNADQIRQINADFNARFLAEKGDVLSNVNRQAGVIEGLMQAQENLIESFPSQLDGIIKTTAQGMFGQSVSDVLFMPDMVGKSTLITQALQKSFDMSSTWTKAETDEVLKGLPKHFYKEINNKVVFDNLTAVAAAEALVGGLQYGNRKLKADDPAYLQLLATIEQLGREKQEQDEYDAKVAVQSEVEELLNKFDEDADAYTNPNIGTDPRGLSGFVDETNDKLEEMYKDDPQKLRIAKGLFATRANIEYADLQRATSIEEKEEREARLAEQKKDAEDRQLKSQIEQATNAALTATSETLEAQFEPSVIDTMSSENGLDFSNYFTTRMKINSTTGEDVPHYTPTGSFALKTGEIRAIMQEDLNAFIREKLSQPRAEGEPIPTAQEIGTMWAREGMPVFMKEKFPKLLYGKMMEEASNAYGGDAKIQQVIKDFDPDETEEKLLKDAYLQGGESRFDAKFAELQKARLGSVPKEYNPIPSPTQKGTNRVGLPRELNPNKDQSAKALEDIEAFDANIAGQADDESIIEANNYYGAHVYKNKAGEELVKDIISLTRGKSAGKGRTLVPLSSDEADVINAKLKRRFENVGVPSNLLVPNEEGLYEHNGVVIPELPTRDFLLQDVLAGRQFVLHPDIDFEKTMGEDEYLMDVAREIYGNDNVPLGANMSLGQIHDKLLDNREETAKDGGYNGTGHLPQEEKIYKTLIKTEIENVGGEEADQLVDEVGKIMSMEAYNFQFGKRARLGNADAFIGQPSQGFLDIVAFFDKLISETGGGIQTPEGAVDKDGNPLPTREEQINKGVQARRDALEKGLNVITDNVFGVDLTDPRLDDAPYITEKVLRYGTEVASGGGRWATKAISKIGLKTTDDALAWWQKRAGKDFRTEAMVAVGAAAGEQIAESQDVEGMGKVASAFFGGVTALTLTSKKFYGYAGLRAKVMGKSGPEVAEMLLNGKFTKAEREALIGIGRLNKRGNFNLEDLTVPELGVLARRYDIDTLREFGVDPENLLPADRKRVMELINDGMMNDKGIRRETAELYLFGGQGSAAFNDAFIIEMGAAFNISRIDNAGNFLNYKNYRKKVFDEFNKMTVNDQKKFIGQFDADLARQNKLLELEELSARETNVVRQVLNGDKRVNPLLEEAYESLSRQMRKEGIDIPLMDEAFRQGKSRQDLSQIIEKHYESLDTLDKRNEFAQRLQDYQKGYNRFKGINKNDRHIDLEPTAKPDGDGPKPDGDDTPPPPPPPDGGGAPKPDKPKPDAPTPKKDIDEVIDEVETGDKESLFERIEGWFMRGGLPKKVDGYKWEKGGWRIDLDSKPKETAEFIFARQDVANKLYRKATGEEYRFRTGDRDLYLEMEAKADQIVRIQEAQDAAGIPKNTPEPEIIPVEGFNFKPKQDPIPVEGFNFKLKAKDPKSPDFEIKGEKISELSEEQLSFLKSAAMAFIKANRGTLDKTNATFARAVDTANAISNETARRAKTGSSSENTGDLIPVEGFNYKPKTPQEPINVGELDLKSITSEFKPTVKHSKSIVGAQRMEADGKGIDVHRKLNTDEHYGNPFSHLKQFNSSAIRVDTVQEAVNNYKKWLAGTDFQDVRPKQREWILEQVDAGVLNNKTLLYYNRKSPNHAEALAEFVAFRKSGSPIKKAAQPKPKPKPSEQGVDLFIQGSRPVKTAEPTAVQTLAQRAGMTEAEVRANFPDRVKELEAQEASIKKTMDEMAEMKSKTSQSSTGDARDIEYNRDPDYGKKFDESGRTSDRYSVKGMGETVEIRGSISHTDISKEGYLTEKGYNRSTLQNILNGQVTAIPMNKGFRPQDGFRQALHKVQNGRVVKFDIRDYEGNPTGESIWLQKTKTEFVKGGKGFTDAQVTRWRKTTGLSQEWFNRATNKQNDTLIFNFRHINTDAKTYKEAQAIADGTAKATSFDNTIDISSINWSKSTIMSPKFGPLTEAFENVNKLVGMPAQKTKRAMGNISKIYDKFQSVTNVGKYEPEDGVGIFFDNIYQGSAKEINAVIKRRVARVVTDPISSRKAWTTKRNKAREEGKDKLQDFWQKQMDGHEKLIAKLEKAGYVNHGNGVFKHKSTLDGSEVITRERTAADKATSISPTKQREAKAQQREEANFRAKAEKLKLEGQKMMEAFSEADDNIITYPNRRVVKADYNDTSVKQANQDVTRAASRETGDATTTLIAGKRREDRDNELISMGTPQENIPVGDTGVIKSNKDWASKFVGVPKNEKEILHKISKDKFDSMMNKELRMANARDEVNLASMTAKEQNAWKRQPSNIRRVVKQIKAAIEYKKKNK